MSKLLRSQIVPYVDLDGLVPGTHYVQVKFELPDGFVEENIRSATASVKVTIRTK
jgi:YbbR domain-containing protein